MTSICESNTNQENFSLCVAKQLFSLEKSDNIVFSPLSLQVVLSIIAAGSKGPTQQQILDFLDFKSINHVNLFVSQLVSIILKDAAPAGGLAFL
ncbi:serpin-ZX-like protein [Medicago truncatula]|uniref:Serpin-ZX-like protein n=1 Tax=Medicago truncatula TaxID=3880 RepID=G7JV34_MEDTR|nr:serpin-ZX-like protein [Medicago truncatula]